MAVEWPGNSSQGSVDAPPQLDFRWRNAYEQLQRWVRPSIVLNRAIYFGQSLPAIVVGPIDGYRNPPVVLGSFALWTIWSIALLGYGLRAKKVQKWVAADALLMFALQIAVYAAVPGGFTNWRNWTLGPAIGTAILVSLYLRSTKAFVLIGIVVVGFAAGSTYELVALQTDISAGAILSAGLMIIVFAIVTRKVVGVLLELAQEVDQVTNSAIGMAELASAARARFDERSRQYDIMHDTVLDTLSKIGRGVLDHRADSVRELCARDAEFLRSLITGSDHNFPGNLVSALSEIARGSTSLGLTVHVMASGLPASLPSQVVGAVVESTRSALSNVSRHARVDEAWVTATSASGNQLRVSIVDRGIGFDLAEKMTRGAISPLQFIKHRMEEVSGQMRVDSAIGEGTSVELTWSK